MAYRVVIFTGDKANAGTDANVWLILHGEDGQTQSPDFKLDVMFRNDNERGEADDFDINVPDNLRLGNLKKIEFWKDSCGVDPSWYVDKIKVEDTFSHEEYYFPVFRWIKSDYHYVIQHLDTSLPQFDENRMQRERELADKQKLYELSDTNLELPAQVKQLPDDEKFSVDYKWDFDGTALKLGIKSLLVDAFSGHWTNLGALKNWYSENHIELPEAADHWTEDSHFGYERVAGVNPVLIRLCTAIPKKFGVTDAMVKTFMEGMTIKRALARKRLFMVDLEILKDIPCKNDQFTVCAPIALFFLNKANKLLPIAIQLLQEKGLDNPVFLPSDDARVWQLAKMWYNNADGAYHQSLTHLGYTHLLMEGVAVVTHRHLSQSHPMFKLLAPHFLYVMAINTLALEKLISVDGSFDKATNIGREGAFALIRERQKTWRMDVDGHIPEDLKQRGVLDKKVLPFYPYRDDALLLYDAIKGYVRKMVKLYYDTPEKLAEDKEIQAWVQEMVKPRQEGGAGIRGVPGNGRFTTTNQLILTLTSIISTCSVGHAAANFGQFQAYGFPPNYPMMLRGKPPNNKEAKTDQDILDALPDTQTVLITIVVATLLSRFDTNALGDFEVNYIFDPPAVEILKLFRRQLRETSKTVKHRNQSRPIPYRWLNPDFVPNAISI